MDDSQLRYLRLLSEQYPTIQAASNAMIRLSALLQLPKGTEHFLSDVHGEYEAFRHVIKNGAGSIWRKIEEMFGSTLSKKEQRNLATLIYYPEQKLPLLLKTVPDQTEWSRQTLFHLIRLCRLLTSKYRLETVRKYLPEQAAAIIEELLYEQEDLESKEEYYNSLIDTVVATGSAPTFIITLAELIQRLAIARLHVLGDIYDRGPGAHLILDALMEYHHVDLQWGNHDIIWMGAAAGSEACMANVIRICLRYGHMEALENGYGISLLPLASFALETYTADPCDRFMPKVLNKGDFTNPELRLMAQMHKAMAIIQFKLEGQMIKRRPHYQMEHRLLLDKIDYERGTIRLDQNEYPLLDTYFPTIDPNDVYSLSAAEQLVVDKLKLSFTNSKKLQQHVRFLFSKGSIYHICNGNLLYHGCIAMNEDGSFKGFNVDGQTFAGKAFLDRVDRLARQGYFTVDNPEQKQYGVDAMWFLWCTPQSPLFGKEEMTTFERYFIADPATHVEKRNPYYDLRDQEETACKILEEFGLDPKRSHIINGHVPVKVKKGESPIKANGRMIVIDGGFSRAYQRETGIAGYTLISNSIGLLLAAHRPFESMQKAISEELDIDSETEIIESHPTRMRVKDTDDGREIQRQIDELRELLGAYRAGLIKEQ
ncbi:fructose 1,6-bisphosphatase [Anaerosporomusa subterranea]|uniref:Fructose-1,6-bisphosphatase class 3 n=1 Tax=Anaerosporomusa subterranea TaxID=1794912 RepID=A0A154BPF9_ANASB|nr:fructose-bisphosphatase class III [Anaerosporomusa subterranea]KYZ75775.1 fructose 1,6-bisphosphatase [Anaerosporomusa subterranea]